MSTVQPDLFVTTEEARQRLEMIPLLYIVEEFRNGILQLPDYQREYVWDEWKEKRWIARLVGKSGASIGIVTYQIRDQRSGKYNSPLFLADGRQRTEASLRFLESPQKYGYQFGPEQARSILMKFSIPHRHEHYENHFEAMEEFQDMQLGTPLTPAQFYRGEMMLFPLGKYAYKHILNTVEQVEHRLPIKMPSPTAFVEHSKYHRDALALFLQYLSDDGRMSFWDVTSTTIGRDKQVVERILMQYLNEREYTPRNVDHQLTSMKQYLEGYISIITEQLSQTGNSGREMSRALARCLLHLAIYRKINRVPVPVYENLVRAVLESSASAQDKMISTAMAIEDDEGNIVIPGAISVGTLSGLRKIADHYGIPMFSGSPRHRKRGAAPGQHASHYQPVRDTMKDGKTRFEPGPSNMSRGAAPIE